MSKVEASAEEERLEFKRLRASALEEIDRHMQVQLRQLETVRAARRRQQLARTKPQVSAPAPTKAPASKEGPGKPLGRAKSPGAGAETCTHPDEHTRTRAAAREAGLAAADVATSSRQGWRR